MATIYTNTNVLRPCVPFTTMICKAYGNNACVFTKSLYLTPLVPSPPATYGAILKRWTGAAWVKAKLQTYTGSWISKPLKVFKAGSWQLVDITGI